MLCEGLSNVEIGERMGLRPKTVRNMMFHAFQLLGVHTRARAMIEVARLAAEAG